MSEHAPERTAAREEVTARIARYRPRVVIAHSLGSVVAFEALHAHPRSRSRSCS
ncbi:lysophospholipase [Streptomyces sp. 35G-GA-8]|uniref:lysophospholipase n=1 Tax=Streptomyces sp. 35G-GA-8 TaxID=2939434 RepID=UPI00201E7678|nr:lysophospholipase [Streptomyces sp. 35G-GA-8]MCL7382440.1 lysophospholipase [Streptomyces sp. 35G-GA-8]